VDGILVFFGALLGLGLLGLVVVLPIIALVRAGRAARVGKRNEENWQKLTQRIHTLEAQVQQLNGKLKTQAAVPVSPEAVPAPAAQKAPTPAAPVKSEPTHPPIAATGGDALNLEPPRPTVVVAPAAPPLSVPPVAAEAAKPPTPLAGGGAAANLPPAKPAAPPVAPPQFQVLSSRKPPVREPAKRVLNMEEVLGTDWLNKLGMMILVIGVAMFLAYEMRELGPAGKVLVGFAVGGGFLGAGIFFERRERWRILARAIMGGGWALLYFTTYAMNHIGAARVLESESADYVLLLIVAAAMVAHTLRYDSRVVTGLAFLLAFSTINISHAPPSSLIASAILAVALVVIVGKRRWFDLEVLAITALYINHFFWLRPIIEPMGEHRHHFPEFIPSALLLIFYWLVFRVSYLLREKLSQEQERVSTFGAVLNSFLLLSVMKYQSVHPEWAFYALLVIGAVEFALGQLPPARRRRPAFVVLSVIGTTLMVAAIPFKYSGGTLPILWLAEAEALFLAGVFLDEVIFCRLGLLAGMLVALQLNRLPLGQIYDPEWKGFHPGERLRGIMEFASTVLVFYGDAHWLARRSQRLNESRIETVMLKVLSYAAAITAAIGIWWLVPEAWVAVGFAALGLILIVLGLRTSIREFSYQGHVAATLAFLRVLAVNFWEPSPHIKTRVATVILTAAMIYASAHWSGLKRAMTVKYVSSWHTWAASLLVGTLAWHELQPISVALAWTILGLILFEAGCAWRLPQLRLQSYLAFVFSFMRLFFVNFSAAGVPGELSPRFYTIVPLALAFFYVYAALDASRDEVLERDRNWKAPEVLCFLGTFTLAGWARFEVQPDWVVVAWAAMIWALAAIAWRYGRRIFLYQGLLLGAAVLMRGTMHNFYERSYFPAPFWQSRSVTIGATVALLFAVLPFAFKLRQKPDDGNARRGRLKRLFSALGRRPDQVFFFIPFILLTVLLALEVPKGMITVAWGAEAVAIFLFALTVGQRSYRLTGLVLLLVCVGKILVLDVWGLQLRDRYLTFIALGAALLGVSFLYTRYREAIRQYL
jgi:hypothetical protein